MNYYPVYAEALGIVQQGWTQRAWKDEDGSCVVQALKDAFVNVEHRAGRRADGLPRALVLEVDAAIRRRHVGQAVLYLFRAPSTETLVSWNDKDWRKRRDVTNVLRGLMADNRRGWLEEEHARLRSEIDFLQRQVRDLSEQLAASERERSGLARLLGRMGWPTNADDLMLMASLEEGVEARTSELESLTAA